MRAIDFFCGGGGMTYGLRQAGINVIAGVDADASVRDTYEENNPGTAFIHADIKKLRNNFFERHFGVTKNDDDLLLVGCSPCQYYSIINTDRTKAMKTKNLLLSFFRFIDYYRPGFVLVENVPGIEFAKDSVLPKFLKKLSSIGYVFEKGVKDLSYYGVPQSRKRFSLIASRLNVPLSLPTPDASQALVGDFIGKGHGFPSIPAGHHDLTDFKHTCAGLDEKSLARLRLTPHNGGGRLSWANVPDLQIDCYIGKDHSFKDNYGRMWWNRPAPTITTKFFSVSSGRFSHPDEDRPISLREGATLQTFPIDYVFRADSISAIAKMIGNAVPCEYARRLGLHVQTLIHQHGAV